MRERKWQWASICLGTRAGRHSYWLKQSVVVALAGLLMVGASAQRLRWLGALTPDASFSQSKDVSASTGVSVGCETAVVGRSVDATGNMRAFLWRRDWAGNVQMVDLGTLGGSWSYAWGISADRRVIVGVAGVSDTQHHACKWWFDENNQLHIEDLGTLGGNLSWARAISNDGSRIVGIADTAAGEAHACLWQGGAAYDLGTLGGAWSDAWGISPDGTAVVGGSAIADGQYRAFLWAEATGMQNLGLPDGEGWLWSWATAVSNNKVVVGAVQDSTTRMAFRWTSQTGMEVLPLPADYNFADAYGVSADGSVIVGRAAHVTRGRVAFRWTADGPEDLNITYAHLLTDGSRLIIARAISPDGNTISGWGYNAATGREEAFVLELAPCGHNGDIDCNGCVDDGDLLIALFHFGEEGDLGRIDVNCDGIVDDADLLIILFHFGEGERCFPGGGR